MLTLTSTVNANAVAYVTSCIRYVENLKRKASVSDLVPQFLFDSSRVRF